MPVVTRLEMAARESGRINLYLDDKFAFAIGLPLVADYFLVKGKTLTEAQIDSLRADDEFQRAQNVALDLLSLRPRSEHELSERLRKREFSPLGITRALARLKELELVNDLKFAEYWINNRSEFKPRGPALLRQELRAKGVPPDIIKTALATMIISDGSLETFTEAENHGLGQIESSPGHDEFALCLQAARKKAPSLFKQEWPVYQRRMLGFLQRRGFSYGHCNKVTRQLWQEHQGQTAPEETEDYYPPEQEDF